jgi:hypothetical protein
MNIRVRVGARSSRDWRDTKPVTLIDKPDYGYVGGGWLEDHGNGWTQRMLVIDYEDLPELIETLSHIHAENVRRTQEARKPVAVPTQGA